MSNTLLNLGKGNTGWASSLGGLLIGSSLALALGACSGDDDEPAAERGDETPSSPMSPSTPSTPSPSAGAPGSSDEGGPNVTDLDESTAPGAPGDDASGGDADAEAAGLSMASAGALDVPDTELCAPVADWDATWVQFEEEVLLIVNEFRSQPADCGVEGQFEAAAPLTMNPILRCSARLHSVDMYERDYFEHDTPDGVDPFERMAEAGFVGSGGGENIAFGQRSPQEVMDDWMASDGHCANIMRANFDTIGVGYHPGSTMRGGNSNFWTQNFGAPPFMRGNRR